MAEAIGRQKKMYAESEAFAEGFVLSAITAFRQMGVNPLPGISQEETKQYLQERLNRLSQNRELKGEAIEFKIAA